MSFAWPVKRLVTLLDGRTFGLGHVSNPAHRFTSIRFALARAGLAVAPVDGLDLRPLMPRNMDQGQTGSCEGHAATKTLVGAFAYQGAPLGFVPSPADLYRGARSIDRGDPSLPLRDVGTEGNSVIRFFQEYGVRRMGPNAPDGRFSVADPATINDEVKLGELEADASCRLVGAYSILDQTQPDLGDVLMQALLAFGPIPIANFVDTAFQQYTAGSPPLDQINTSDPNGGGHKIVLAGWRWFKDGQQVTGTTPGAVRLWIVDNSWGANNGWGDGQGSAFATDNWIAQTDEREAYAVRRAA